MAGCQSFGYSQLCEVQRIGRHRNGGRRQGILPNRRYHTPLATFYPSFLITEPDEKTLTLPLEVKDRTCRSQREALSPIDSSHSPLVWVPTGSVVHASFCLRRRLRRVPCSLSAGRSAANRRLGNCHLLDRHITSNGKPRPRLTGYHCSDMTRLYTTNTLSHHVTVKFPEITPHPCSELQHSPRKLTYYVGQLESSCSNRKFWGAMNHMVCCRVQ